MSDQVTSAAAAAAAAAEPLIPSPELTRSALSMLWTGFAHVWRFGYRAVAIVLTLLWIPVRWVAWILALPILLPFRAVLSYFRRVWEVENLPSFILAGTFFGLLAGLMLAGITYVLSAGVDAALPSGASKSDGSQRPATATPGSGKGGSDGEEQARSPSAGKSRVRGGVLGLGWRRDLGGMGLSREVRQEDVGRARHDLDASKVKKAY